MHYSDIVLIARWLFFISWIVFVGTAVTHLFFFRKAILAVQKNAENIAAQRKILIELEVMHTEFIKTEESLAGSVAIIGTRARALDDLLEVISERATIDRLSSEVAINEKSISERAANEIAINERADSESGIKERSEKAMRERKQDNG